MVKILRAGFARVVPQEIFELLYTRSEINSDAFWDIIP